VRGSLPRAACLVLALLVSTLVGCGGGIEGLDQLPVGSAEFIPGAGVVAAPPAPGGGGLTPLTDGPTLMTEGTETPVPTPSPSRGGEDGAPGFLRPAELRGLYLNAWAAGSRTRSAELIELARRTEINTFVIDIKDASGFVSYPTGVALATEIGADREIRIRDVRALLDQLAAEGIWTVARIVVFKDPIMAHARPDVAVQDGAGGPWIDGRGDVWVNPWNRIVWDYHVALAREAVELGFREIQWDYIRFPDRPASELAEAVFPGADGRARSEAVREFLLHSRAALADLGVPLTADVFGVSTSAAQDVGIGQLWEHFIDIVDAALPMVYPSHYWEGSFGYRNPNAYPYEIVQEALRHAQRRSAPIPGAGRVIPWLQDFTLGQPPYGVAEVRAQILGARDIGIHEWILWNASSRYTEGALEPVGGWPGGVEPPIRFGGEIIPAGDRFRAQPAN